MAIVVTRAASAPIVRGDGPTALPDVLAELPDDLIVVVYSYTVVFFDDDACASAAGGDDRARRARRAGSRSTR